MNIQEARKALFKIEERFHHDDDIMKSVRDIERELNEIEQVLKNNSIKQTPALFKPFDVNK